MDIRQKIIASVFTKRNPPETYVSHVKIWEDAEDDARKPRYILLSRNLNNEGFIHKSKMNTNGTFSIGKTWKLRELRGVEVIDANNFVVTLARSYRWQSEDSTQQSEFVVAVIQTFKSISPNGPPLSIINVPSPNAPNNRPISPKQPPQSPQPRISTDRLMPRATTPSKNATINVPLPNASDNDSTSSRQPPQRPQQRISIDRLIPRAVTPSKSVLPTINVPLPNLTLTPSKNAPLSNVPDIGSTRPLQPRISTDRLTPRVTTPSRSVPSAVNVPLPVTPDNRITSPKQQPPQPPQSRTSTDRLPPRTATPSKSAPMTAGPSALDRLLSTGSSNGFEEDSLEVIMANVEEMLEGNEWLNVNDAASSSGTKRKRTAADQIEARLQDELVALEKATIYAFLEDDDRVGLVLKYIDDTLGELDSMDTMISSYKIHLNTVSDDISYIQSQSRRLQVQAHKPEG